MVRTYYTLTAIVMIVADAVVMGCISTAGTSLAAGNSTAAGHPSPRRG